ncbi:hypothetical protein OROGR_022699 [Orobanche gracilis]
MINGVDGLITAAGTAIVDEKPRKMSSTMNIQDIVLIKDEKTKRSFTVRVLRMWTPMNAKGKPQCIEMILLDREGSKIQASVHVSLVMRFKKLLIEGSTFIIEDFQVEANEKTKWQQARVNHQFRLRFEYCTRVHPYLKDNDISKNGFQFISAHELQTQSIDESYYVDVIGEIKSWGKMETIISTNFSGRKMDVILHDVDDCPIECVLWEAYGDEIIQFMENHGDSNDRVILIIQFGKKTTYLAKSRVATVKYATKIFVNADFPEVEDFYAKKRDKGSVSFSRSITHLSNDTKSNSNWDWFNGDRHRNLAELRSMKEPGFYTVKVYASTIDVKSTWYYNACGSCNTKVNLDVNLGDICSNSKCNMAITKIVPRYVTGTSIFLMFQDVVMQLINKTAEDLLDSLKREGYEECFPDEFDAIIKREYLCKVKVHQEFNINQNKNEYSVDKITSDEDMIDKFAHITNSEVVSRAASGHETYMRTHIDEKVAACDEQDSCDSTSSEITPMKRASTSNMTLYDDYCDMQMSCSKIVKREK